MPRFARLAAASLAAALLAAPALAPAALAEETDAPGVTLTGDASKGARVFNRCKACHTVEEGGPARVGPNLYGIVGAEFGHVAGYNYSDNLMELKAEGRVWDIATLDAYLKQPRDVIPKGIMSFVGLPRESDRANVIAYLATFGGPAPEDAPAPAD